MKECNRLLSIGGNLIIAEVNNIFDIATFNKFTVQFYTEHLLPLTFTGAAESNEMHRRISELLVHPDKLVAPLPSTESVSYVDAILDNKETRYSSHRDQASSKAENPLAYEQLVKKYDFAMRDLAFYHFHAVPPLLFNSDPGLGGEVW